MLGLHYMTVYRYVRTGQLAATRDGGQWRVTRPDVEALRARPACHDRTASGQRDTTAERSRIPNAAGAGRVERLAERLVAGDAVGSWTIVERALASGAEPADVHLDLLGPALELVGTGGRVAGGASPRSTGPPPRPSAWSAAWARCSAARVARPAPS